MSTETKQPNYWKSLNELAHNEEYKKFAHREFPENATELTDGVSRRSFLRIMGASIAMAGFMSCRRPVQKIIPYSRQPEDVEEGIPMHYATAMPLQGVLNGLLVESNEGRPSKAEGNDEHPGSLGSTSVFGQASILNLYDPDRSGKVLKDGEESSWKNFVDFASTHFSDTEQNIVFISEANSSLTLNELKQQALENFPNAKWITHEPFGQENIYEGNKIAFGQKLRTVNHFDKANIIVSLDDDFLSPAANPDSVATTKAYSESRRVLSTSDSMSRLYMVENTMSLTGSNADNRLRLKAAEIEPFLMALAGSLSAQVDGLDVFEGYSNSFSDHEWIQTLTSELLENASQSILTLGAQHSKHAHAVVAAINVALTNKGKTVQYLSLPYLNDQDEHEALQQAVEDMRNGQVDTVVTIGSNAVFTAPADLNVAEAIANVDTSINLSEFVDETARLSNWHVNRAHFLESWSDGYSFKGSRSVIQPLIRPLYDGKNELEFLAAIAHGKDEKAYDLVQNHWKTLGFDDFRASWRTILHEGVGTGNHFDVYDGNISTSFSNSITKKLNNDSDTSGIELVFRPDSGILDGRFANNGWLQEMPDPITKITWDNVALMSKSTAEKLGVSNKDALRISNNGNDIEIAAWILPGHADDSITVTVGYGRTEIGNVADGSGVDTYLLRTTEGLNSTTSASFEPAGRTLVVATTQDHHSMEGRSIVRSGTLDHYKEEPEFASFKGVYGHNVPGLDEAESAGEEEPINLFNDQDFPEYEPQWGMTIDLNTCTGCSACVVACVAENNIPVIGKREVNRGREMHWIRTDRYFEGDVDEPNVVHQPVPCMQCELAPCEQVCPVAATTHSDDGMNQMAYNRCIGTRYCANNCPYKVRRFNFFNYTKEFLTTGKDPELVQMAMNPEVTVRFRGVMEKCTYCVQRVNRAKINRKIETDGQSIKPLDGTVKTACQQACPANAIAFGDLTNDQSEVVSHKKNERNYSLLEELNTRPRTTYLAKLKNPNPALTPVSQNHNEHH